MVQDSVCKHFELWMSLKHFVTHSPLAPPDQIFLAGTPVSKWYDWNLGSLPPGSSLSKSVSRSDTKVQEAISHKGI